MTLRTFKRLNLCASGTKVSKRAVPDTPLHSEDACFISLAISDRGIGIAIIIMHAFNASGISAVLARKIPDALVRSFDRRLHWWRKTLQSCRCSFPRSQLSQSTLWNHSRPSFRRIRRVQHNICIGSARARARNGPRDPQETLRGGSSQYFVSLRSCDQVSTPSEFPRE
jgi:hypothetical protein